MLARKSFLVCLVLLLCLLVLRETGVVQAQSSGSSPPYVSSVAALLIEWNTGQILFEKNAFRRMHPASLTKMMTGLLAVELARLDDRVTISGEAASQPGSSMYLKKGDVFALQDLLYGLMLNSGNDAAWAIAEHVAKETMGPQGTASDFFDMMNRRAKEIGAINTRFANPHGLTEANHYTTAFDLALIAKTCLKHPYFKHLVATKEKDVIEAGTGARLILSNTNRLLWMYLGTDGVKTGTTESAGQCLVASATRDGVRLLAVVLDSLDRWSDAAKLLDYGFNGFTVSTLAKAWEPLVWLPCSGSGKTVPVVPIKDISACVPRGSSDLWLDIHLPPSIRRQCSRGTVLGYATVYLGDTPVNSCDLVAGAHVVPRTPVQVAVRLLSWLVREVISRL